MERLRLPALHFDLASFIDQIYSRK